MRGLRLCMTSAVDAGDVFQSFPQNFVIAGCSLRPQLDNVMMHLCFTRQAILSNNKTPVSSPRQAAWKDLRFCTLRYADFRVRLFLDVRSIRMAARSLWRGRHLSTHAPYRGTYTKCGVCSAAHHHGVGSAKPVGNAGMASDSGSRTNRR